MVVESFSSEREEFLTVEKGQLVEVLDQGGSNWLVVTIPAPGELETEGFLPATCLRPAGEGECMCVRGCCVCGVWEILNILVE